MGGIDFSDDESVRQYCLQLQEKTTDKSTGIHADVLTGFDNVLVRFGDKHVFKLSAEGAIEEKRGKVIKYDTIDEWENEIIETGNTYLKAGHVVTRGYMM